MQNKDSYTPEEVARLALAFKRYWDYAGSGCNDSEEKLSRMEEMLQQIPQNVRTALRMDDAFLTRKLYFEHGQRIAEALRRCA